MHNTCLRLVGSNPIRIGRFQLRAHFDFSASRSQRSKVPSSATRPWSSAPRLRWNYSPVGLSGDCDDCVCPDFTPQIEANCKAACSLPAPAPAPPTYTEVRDVCRRNGNHAWSGDGEERRSCATLKSWCDSNPSCTAYQINSGNSWCATFTGPNPPNNAGGSGGHRCWIKNAATTAFIETGTSAQVRVRRHSSAELCL